MAAEDRTRWLELLEHSRTPMFVLNTARRLQFVNSAWNQLTGESTAEAIGSSCSAIGPTKPLYRTLAPPASAPGRSVTTVRRPAPPQRLGPPWWDITFINLHATEGQGGWLGLIDVIAPDAANPPKSLTPTLAGLRLQHNQRFTFDLFAGATLRSLQFQDRLRFAASHRAAVWIHGEPATGRRTAARIIHANSPLHESPCVIIDCRALQPHLIEALLFGTGGLAGPDRIGTLVLDDPAALPLDFQTNILDWLANAKAPPRFVGISRNPPTTDVQAGTLHANWARAFATIELETEPLRQRTPELPAIIARMLAQPKEIAAEALAALEAYAWPGNLIQLRQVLALLPPGGETIRLTDLPRFLREPVLISTEPARERPSLDAILQSVERRLILQALQACHGNHTQAAERLGIFRSRLLRRLEALGLSGSGS